jgi:hypothetical protein
VQIADEVLLHVVLEQFSYCYFLTTPIRLSCIPVFFLVSSSPFTSMEIHFNIRIGLLLVLNSLSALLVSQSNVGIGTLSPTYRLDVQGDPANSALINFQSKVNYTGSVSIKAIEGISIPADGFGIGAALSGGLKGVDAYGVGGGFTGITYGVSGTALGTAGVRYGVYGTASGGAINAGVYGIATGGAGYYGILASNTNLSGYAGYFSGRGHFTEELRADKNMIVDDNLGIGTNAPVSKLHIINGTDAGLATNGFAQFGTTASWNLVFDDNEIMARNNGAGNDLLMQQDAGNILMCGLELGRVGIGVQLAANLPAGYMLAVDGKIIGEEMRIQNSNNWPDYVFAEEYNLMPLDELKETITRQKHLPNIPPASVVEEEGILIGDMQKRMMEKIEELTLYLLELHESNKQLRTEVEWLKKELSSFKGQ